jgi:hypothetical protein
MVPAVANHANRDIENIFVSINASLTEPTLYATAARPPLSPRDFAIALDSMIAVESSNRQHICRRLPGPFTNKLRSAGSGWQKMSEANSSTPPAAPRPRLAGGSNNDS